MENLEVSLRNNERKNLSHSFTYEQLMLRIATIRDTTTRELDSASKNVDIDALQLTTKITGEVIIRTFFGQSFGESIINGRNAALEIQYTIGNSFDLL
jgi:cytochrome P450